MLRPWIATMRSDQLLWGESRSRHYKAASLLRLDLEAAGIPDVVRTNEGLAVVDFHSFRGLQVTNAMRTGQPSRVVMRVARLSSEKLLDRYLKISGDPDSRSLSREFSSRAGLFGCRFMNLVSWSFAPIRRPSIVRLCWHETSFPPGRSHHESGYMTPWDVAPRSHFTADPCRLCKLR